MATRPRMLRTNWRCWEYDETGHVCGRFAVAVDPYRGYAVCDTHAWWVCTNCETTNPVEAEVCEDCGMPRVFSEREGSSE